MQSFMQMINSLIGLITPLNVLLLLASTCGGILIGALPGLSATMGIALLTGLTYTMSQDMALIVLLGHSDRYPWHRQRCCYNVGRLSTGKERIGT